MNVNLGSSRRWRRRLDDLRYLPGDTLRRLRATRERWLAAWAGYNVGQRLSSVGLAAAVLLALVVVATGGGTGSDGDVVVAKERTGEPSGMRRGDAPRRDADATTVPVPVGTETTPPSPASSMELTEVDNSAVVADDDPRPAEVLGATTVPAKGVKRGVEANGNRLADLLQAALRATRSAAAGPAPAPPAAASPTTVPPTPTPTTARPPATPTTTPPVTAAPTTQPPVTVPPTTEPPVTTPPTTDPPPTTEPPGPAERLGAGGRNRP